MGDLRVDIEIVEVGPRLLVAAAGEIGPVRVVEVVEDFYGKLVAEIGRRVGRRQKLPVVVVQCRPRVVLEHGEVSDPVLPTNLVVEAVRAEIVIDF